MAEIIILVRLVDGKVTVDKEQVELSVGQTDTARWVTNGNEDFEIDFGGSHNCPFDWPNGKAQGRGTGGVKSGSIRKPSPKPYDYTVSMNQAAADPQIIIRP